MKDLLQDILCPSSEFTPIPFWFFNDEPDEEKIKSQLQDYVEKGVNGFVLHPRIGIPESVPYLSEAYFQAVRFIVKTAAELDMKVVLYDEGMYPSGSAHGMVVQENPDFASRGIRIVPGEEFHRDAWQSGLCAEPVRASLITELSGGRCLIYTFTGGNIRGIYFGEDDGEFGAPPSADILNPDAVDCFIRLTHDRYYEELKEYFGSTIIAFFTDEPSALGRNAGSFREWVPGMERELEAAGGRLEELEGLFTGQENNTTEIYHKLVKKYLREIFYARLSNWCESHGIALMGHPEASDDVEEELYFHIPGQDLIMRRVSPESGGLLEFDSVQAKLSADIARHLGRRRNANECFGVCYREGIPWYFTGADMKWYIDWLGLRGVNLFVPHAFYYSVSGKRREERPPDVGPNNIWWKHYRKVSDYMKRLSFLMTDSHSEARVAVLCDNNRVPYKELAYLYENQIDFHYLPVAFLQDARTENGKLCLGEYKYDAVLNVTDPAWNEMLSGVQTVSRAEALCADKSLRTVSAEAAGEKGDCRGLRAVSFTKKGGKHMILFSNESEKEISVRVSLPVTSVFVDLWRGRAWREAARAADGETSSAECALHLYPRETLLVMEDTEGELAEAVSLRPREVCLGDFTKQFELKEKENNKAFYTMKYDTKTVTGQEIFTVRGGEMAECFCNGRLADVSLFEPHRILVGPFLEQGENELTLVMTGSAANIFCGAQIPFGLEKE